MPIWWLDVPRISQVMHLEGYCQPHCFSSPSLTLNPSEIQDRDPHNRIMPMNVFYKWLICAAGKLTFLTVLPKFVVFCTFFCGLPWQNMWWMCPTLLYVSCLEIDGFSTLCPCFSQAHSMWQTDSEVNDSPWSLSPIHVLYKTFPLSVGGPD